MAPPSHLVVGLGNPGADYVSTRHNIGFMAVDALAPSGAWQKKFGGLIQQADLSGVSCLLLKPMTYMNLSGESVGEALRFFKLTPAQTIVFHDDIDLPSGKIKVKQGGGAAGHNGLKSLDAHIGKDYWRVRLGVGHPGNRDLVHDYVLGSFAKADKAWLEPLLESLPPAFTAMLEGKPDVFMNRVAQRVDEKETR